jgi:hypothetical protein
VLLPGHLTAPGTRKTRSQYAQKLAPQAGKTLLHAAENAPASYSKQAGNAQKGRKTKPGAFRTGLEHRYFSPY